jgi:hypothetical protein
MVGCLQCCSVAREGAHFAREFIARKRQISEFLAEYGRRFQRPDFCPENVLKRGGGLDQAAKSPQASCSCPRLCSRVLSALMWSGPTSQQPPMTLAPASSHSRQTARTAQAPGPSWPQAHRQPPPGSSASTDVKPFAKAPNANRDLCKMASASEMASGLEQLITTASGSNRSMAQRVRQGTRLIATAGRPHPTRSAQHDPDPCLLGCGQDRGRLGNGGDGLGNKTVDARRLKVNQFAILLNGLLEGSWVSGR